MAGHIGAGETAVDAVDAVDAAIREAREELGLEISDLQHFGTLREQFVLNSGTYIDNEIHEIFLARQNIDLAELVLDASEVMDVALVTVDEMASYELVPHPDEYALIRSLV